MFAEHALLLSDHGRLLYILTVPCLSSMPYLAACSLCNSSRYRRTLFGHIYDMHMLIIPSRRSYLCQVEALRQPYIKIVEDMSLKLQTPAGICCPFKMQWVVAHTAEG